MSIRRGLAYSFGRSGVGFLIAFASNVILARLLLPSEIGIFSVALAATAVISALRDFGIGRYLIKEPELTKDKVGTVFAMALIIGWGLAAVIYLGRGLVADFYDEPRVADVLAVSAIQFMVLPFGQPAFSLLRRDRRFARIALITVVSAAVGAAVSILLAALGFGPLSLAYGNLAGVLVIAIMALHAEPKHILLRPTFKEWRSVASFGGIASLTTIVTTVGMQAPELVLGRALGFAAVGFYSKGVGLAQAFERLFVVAISFVTGAEFGALARGKESMKALTLKSTDYIVAVGWPFLLFLGFNSTPIISFLFGPNWLPAAPILTALCVARAVSLLVSQAPALYEGSGAIGLQCRNEMVLQTASVALLLVGIPFGLVAVAWLRVVLAVLSVLVHATVYRKHAKVGLVEIGRSTKRSIRISVCFAFALACFAWFEPPGWEASFPMLIVETILAGCVYLILLFVFAHPLRHELVRLIPLQGRFESK